MSHSSSIFASRMVLALIPILLAHRIDPASAADSNALAEPVALPTVVVTPTRLPTPESEVGSSITVITDEEIQRKQERTLPDALKDVPGLNVVQTGGPGGTTSVFIRGANSNQTKVFIDGIDATDPATGTFNFEHRFLSVEPLIGPVGKLDLAGIEARAVSGSGPRRTDRQNSPPPTRGHRDRDGRCRPPRYRFLERRRIRRDSRWRRGCASGLWRDRPRPECESAIRSDAACPPATRCRPRPLGVPAGTRRSKRLFGGNCSDSILFVSGGTESSQTLRWKEQDSNLGSLSEYYCSPEPCGVTRITDDTAWPLAQHVCRTAMRACGRAPSSLPPRYCRHLGLHAWRQRFTGSPSSLPFLRMPIFRAAARARFLTECGQVRPG